MGGAVVPKRSYDDEEPEASARQPLKALHTPTPSWSMSYGDSPMVSHS
jgi:hypothetical protein